MHTKSIFLDGRMVQAKAELIDSLAPGIVQGKGVFETMRTYDGTIFALEDHLKRLLRGLKLYKVQLPYSKKRLRQHLDQTIQANHLKEARIRLAVWKEGARLRTAIVCRNAGGYSDLKYRKGFKAMISDVRREKTRFSHIKSMDYACFRRAFMQAQDKGYDEAVLLNHRKELVEGSRTNIFFVKKGILYTPAVKCGCLNGITRQIVMKLARAMGTDCKTVVVGVNKLLQADEAFVTNSLIGVMPLTAVGGRLIGQGKAGAFTGKLRNAYDTNVHSSCSVGGESV